MSDDALNGRNALVTGASGGIGAAICRQLAGCGVNVAVAYAGNAPAADALAGELREPGGVSAVSLRADMEDPEAPAALVRAAEQALGPLDLLIANHGVAEPAGYQAVDAAAFDRTLAVNLRAPFLLAQAVLPGMRERSFGRVLFISSGAAFTGGVVGPHYAASKAGLHGLTHFLAARTAADGVTVNALAPGFVETGMLPGDPSELSGRVPVGRVGQPHEVADFAIALLRNGYLTNHVFSIDGGMHPR